MASVNFEKHTIQELAQCGVHFDENHRKTKNHSNQHINPELSHLNYNIGKPSYKSMVEEVKRRVKETDELIPPKRVKSDRKTCFLLEVPCPKEIEDEEREDEFFSKVWKLYNDLLPGCMVGGQIHRDEKHEYYDPNKGGYVESLYHAHFVGVPLTENGINMKAFLTRDKCKLVNDAIQEMVLREFGVSYQVGESPRGKAVEQLKAESELAEAQLKAKEADEKLQVRNGQIEDTDIIIQMNEKIIQEQDERIEEMSKQLQRIQYELEDTCAEVDAKKEELEDTCADIDGVNNALAEVLIGLGEDIPELMPTISQLQQKETVNQQITADEMNQTLGLLQRVIRVVNEKAELVKKITEHLVPKFEKAYLKLTAIMEHYWNSNGKKWKMVNDEYAKMQKEYIESIHKAGRDLTKMANKELQKVASDYEQLTAKTEQLVEEYDYEGDWER